MLIRIVKLELREECVPDFLANFELVKDTIRHFPGCQHLKLLQDKADQTVLFTYSKWKREEDLENYRKSDFFKGVWTTTKPMFRSKAQAWSVDALQNVE